MILWFCEGLPQEQPFTFRSISLYVLFGRKLFWIESSGHLIGGSGQALCLSYGAHRYQRACTTSSGCTYGRRYSALPELTGLPSTRAGGSGTGVRKSNRGRSWRLEWRREFSSALENTEWYWILLYAINRTDEVLLWCFVSA